MEVTSVERVSFWMVTGPFDNPEEKGRRIGLDIPYPPEKSPLDATECYTGKAGKKVSWTELAPQPNGFYELQFVVGEPDSVAYALAYLITKRPGRVTLNFSTYAGIKVFVNGDPVGTIDPPGETLYDPLGQSTTFTAELKRRRNELLVKCEHGKGSWGFFFKVTMARPTLQDFMRREAHQLMRKASRPPLEPASLRRWQVKTRRELVRLMCFPEEKIPPRIKLLEKRDCGSYIQEHFYFRSERNWEVPALLLIPKTARRNRSSKALLCLHGHGHGKAVVALDFDFADMGEWARRTYHDYGCRFAEEGYVVMTIDSRAFGELADAGCSAAYALANAIGRPLVGLRVWDAMKALDIPLARPEVDPERIGCTGLSWGGTHTAYLTMLDTRIKADLVSGYFSNFEDILYRTPVCPCQYLPGVAIRFDFQDLLFGLTAPRPLYIQNGEKDTLYTPAIVKKAFREGARIYKRIGVLENAVLEMHDGAHEYRFKTAREWFEKVL